MVPNIVAFGIVLSGFSIFPAGIVAHSMPKKANKVKVATAEKALKSLSAVRLKSGKLSMSKKKIPIIIIKMIGKILIIVVKSWIFPDSFIPNVLIHVKNQISISPKLTDRYEFVDNTGKKKLAAPIIAIAIVPLATQQAIQ